MRRSAFRTWMVRLLATATAVVIAGTGAALAKRFWSPWRERTIERAVFERSGPNFWWPPSWRRTYEIAEPIFRPAETKRFNTIHPHIWELVGTARAHELEPILEHALGHSNELIRYCATIALGELGPDAESAVPLLAKELEDQNEGMAFVAIIALGRVGPGADTAIPTLARCLQNHEHRSPLRAYAARSLGQIGSRAISSLLDALREPSTDAPVQSAIIKALGAIGPDAELAVPTILESAARDSSLADVAEQAVYLITGRPIP